MEGEDDGLVGEFHVHHGEGVELLLEGVSLLVLSVQDDLHDRLTVSGELASLARDVDGGDDVVEESLVDRGEGARAGAHLQTLASIVGIDHSPLSDNDNVLLGELLLELLDQTTLDSLDSLPDTGGDVHDDALLAGLDFNFLSGVDGDVLKLGLVVAGGGSLDVNQGLCDIKLELSRGTALLGDLALRSGHSVRNG